MNNLYMTKQKPPDIIPFSLDFLKRTVLISHLTVYEIFHLFYSILKQYQ